MRTCLERIAPGEASKQRLGLMAWPVMCLALLMQAALTGIPSYAGNPGQARPTRSG